MARKKPTTEGPRTPPERNGRATNFRMDEQLSEAMEAYMASLDVEPTRTAVIERAVKDFLQAKGFWPPKPQPKPPQA